MKYDVTIIVTIHAEGRILHRTFKALKRSVNYARTKGVTVEILCILDKCSDTITGGIVESWQRHLKDKISVLDVDYGAVADARNFGVGQARGEYIALLDGDDLFGEKWIFKAYNECLQDKNIIVHPAAGYYFPVEPFLRFYSANEGSFLDLIYTNIFTVATMAHRDIYLNVPSVKNTDIWAFQDWLWHCDAAAKGYRHKIVPGTIIAFRQKPFIKSLWQNNVSLNKVIRPNDLFRKIFLREFDGIGRRYHSKMKMHTNFLERSTISFLDKCYSENLAAYRLIIDFKRKVLSFFNKYLNKSVKNWVVEELEMLSEIEPQLAVVKNLIIRFTASHCSFYNVISKEMSWLVDSKNPKIYLLQDLSAASLNALSLSSNETDDHVYIITTNRFPHRFKSQLFGKFVHIDIGNTNLIFAERLNLLHRLLLEATPEFIHIVGSHVAFEMFNRYGATFRNMKVIATVPSPGLNSKRGLTYTGLNWELVKYPELFDFFDHIHTDSLEYKNKLLDIFGIDNSLVTIRKI